MSLSKNSSVINAIIIIIIHNDFLVLIGITIKVIYNFGNIKKVEMSKG